MITRNDFFTVGQGVRRIKGTSSIGRAGNLMESFDGKALVYWVFESDGKVVVNGANGLGVKNWVRFENLELLDGPVSVREARQEWNDAIDAGEPICPNNVTKFYIPEPTEEA